MTATARARLPISAVVITRDAAQGIAATLSSVSFCAERLVLDSGSTDATVEIARTAGARVEQQPFLGYGPQKRRAVELAAHDWILSLDADEVRRTFIGRREVRHGPWGGEQVLRLFNRTTAGFTPQAVHEEVRAKRPPQLLPGSILHYSFENTAAVLLRSIRYARLKAGVMRGKGQRTSAWTMPWRGASAFAKAYLLQGGWRDGPDGFVIALSRVIDSTLPRAMLLLGEDDDVLG
jgi:glycosyltransferase involved in cell wall biosynthesis